MRLIIQIIPNYYRFEDIICIFEHDLIPIVKEYAPLS